MKSRLIQSLQEADEYAKGDTTKGYETKIKVSEQPPLVLSIATAHKSWREVEG